MVQDVSGSEDVSGIRYEVQALQVSTENTENFRSAC